MKKSVTGYKKDSLDVNEPELLIDSSHITTKNMAFPISANGRILYPDTGDYFFPEGVVHEKPIMQDAGQFGFSNKQFISSMRNHLYQADQGMDENINTNPDIQMTDPAEITPFNYDPKQDFANTMSQTSDSFKGKTLQAPPNKKFNPNFVPALGLFNTAITKFTESKRAKELDQEYRRMQTLSNMSSTIKPTGYEQYGNPYVYQQGGQANPEMMQEWNNYVSWLDKQGMKGKPQLDSNNTGFKYLEDYKKANPNTLLSKETIPQIQTSLQDYRNWVIEGHKTGTRPVKFSEQPNEDYSNFMPFIGNYEKQGRKWGDGYPGQYTTSVMFPSEYLNQQRVGFASVKKKCGGSHKKKQFGGVITDFAQVAPDIIPMEAMPVQSKQSYNIPQLKFDTENVKIGKNQGERTNYVFEYLKSKGLPEHAAAGITGNLAIESGHFDQNVVSGKRKGDGGKAIGIAQWHPDRWNKLMNWSKKQNMNPFVLETQLDYVIQEATDRGDLEKTINTKNSEEAAYIFGKKFERPNDKFAKWGNRQGIAKQLHMKEGGEYELSPQELLQFLQNGGEVEYLID